MNTKILDCPHCKGPCIISGVSASEAEIGPALVAYCAPYGGSISDERLGCGYVSPAGKTEKEAIAAHNRIASLVQLGAEVEAAWLREGEGKVHFLLEDSSRPVVLFAHSVGLALERHRDRIR